MFVFGHQGKKGIERVHFRHRRVAVPLEVGAHPVHLPDVLRFDIGRFGNRRFHFLAWVVPDGTDFEQFDALALQAKAEVELAADRGRRTVRFDKSTGRFFDPLAFKFAESHGVCLSLLNPVFDCEAGVILEIALVMSDEVETEAGSRKHAQPAGVTVGRGV